MSNELLDTSEPIARDYPCLGCEYNLHGLFRDGQCPECGLSVQQAIRVFEEGEVCIPGRLKIVSVLHIIIGVLSLISFFPKLVNHLIELPIDALMLPMGFGFLRLSKRWRIAALVWLVLALAMSVPMLVLMTKARQSSLRVFGSNIASLPKVYSILFVVLFATLIAWMTRVLLDPRISILFRVIGPRFRSIKPEVCQLHRNLLIMTFSGSVAAGLFLACLILIIK
jgi:hypothetical protein